MQLFLYTASQNQTQNEARQGKTKMVINAGIIGEQFGFLLKEFYTHPC